MQQASEDLFAWLKKIQKNENAVSHNQTQKQFNLDRQESFSQILGSPNKDVFVDWNVIQDRTQIICQNTEYVLQILSDRQLDFPKEQTRINKLFNCREIGREIMEKLKLFNQVELAATNYDTFQSQLDFIYDDEEIIQVRKGGSSKLKQKKAKQQIKSKEQYRQSRYQIYEQSSQDQTAPQNFQQYSNCQQQLDSQPKIILRSSLPNSSMWPRQMKYKVLVTIPRAQFECPFLLARKIALIKNCCLHKLFGRLQGLSKQKTLSLSKTVRFSLIGIDKLINEQSVSQNHSCKICQLEFDSGRKLGGHMSRKHPGNSSQYYLKKQMQNARADQKNRRGFFKGKGFTNKKSIFEDESEIQEEEDQQALI